MYTMVHNITIASSHLPTTEGFMQLVLVLGGAMLLSGIAGATISWLFTQQTWQAVAGVDSDLNMVYPEAVASDDPEIWFFGSPLPEGDDLDVSDRIVSWLPGTQAVSTVLPTKARATEMAQECPDLLLALFDVTVCDKDIAETMSLACMELPVAKVNSLGRPYDSVTGRFIAKRDYNKYVMPWSTL